MWWRFCNRPEKVLWDTMSENVASDICAQQGFRSACAIAQSDQNLYWAHFGYLYSYLYWIHFFFHAENEDADQTWMRRLIWVRLAHMCVCVGCGGIILLSFCKEIWSNSKEFAPNSDFRRGLVCRQAVTKVVFLVYPVLLIMKTIFSINLLRQC